MKTPLSSGLAGRAKGLWAPGRILEGAWSWWGELWTTLAGLAPPEFRICAVEYSVVRSKCRALFKMVTPGPAAWQGVQRVCRREAAA